MLYLSIVGGRRIFSRTAVVVALDAISSCCNK
jgi:hypothetical protein